MTFFTLLAALTCQRSVVKPVDDPAPPIDEIPVVVPPVDDPIIIIDPPPQNGENDQPWGRPTVYQKYLQRPIDPAPPLPPTNIRCETLAEVRNYQGLDGCQMLLETDAGNLLLVASISGGQQIELGSRIRFGFEYVNNAASACQHADATIRISCVQQVRETSYLPRPIVCEAYDEISEWLYDFALEYAATYITRFPWSSGRYAYLFESADGQYLYDCQGYVLCKAPRNCLQFIEDFSEGVIIYEN